VLSQLSEEDAARLRRMMVDLEKVDGDEERRILGDFVRHRNIAEERGNSGVELTLSGAASTAIAASTSRPAANPEDNTPFRFLHAAGGEKITPFLAGEHPQTIAVVLSHMPDDRAAAVLAQLDGNLQTDVIRRLIDRDQAYPDVVREVELALETRMLEQALADGRQDSGLKSVARILDAAGPALRRRIVANVARHDRDLAERFCQRQFLFDDLRYLDEATLATILASAGAELTRLALAGADAQLVDRILMPLGAAQAKKIRRTIERIGPVRLSDVEQAQREVARIARQLALEGTIDLPNSDGVLAMA
ncbi:MAG: FliG C-terminal domain-containing protein, partial [Bradyrhizobium sp.]